MKNAAEWLKEIEDLYEGQKTGRITPPKAVEMNNTIGKLIAFTKMQLEHHKQQTQLKEHAAKIPQLDAPKP